MAIEFTCPACGGTLRVRDTVVGQVVRCGGCLTLLRVPDVEPVSPSPPAAAPDVEPPRPAPIHTSPPADSYFPNPTDESRPIRGTRFWFMVTVATVILGACGFCGLAAVFLPGPDWQSFESKEGGFRVELPGPPRNDMRQRFQAPDAKIVEGTRLWTRGENYVISCRDLREMQPGLWKKSDDEILDEQLKRLTAGGNVLRVTRTEAIEVGGFAAREFEYDTRNSGTYTGRVIVAGPRLYVLLAGGRFTQPHDENVRRFLDSFEIIDPKLVAEGKRRAERQDEAQEQTLRERIRNAGAAVAEAAMAAVEAEINAPIPDREP